MSRTLQIMLRILKNLFLKNDQKFLCVSATCPNMHLKKVTQAVVTSCLLHLSQQSLARHQHFTSNSEILVSGHNLLFFHGCSKSSGHPLFHLTETCSSFLTLLSTYPSVLSFLHFPPYLAVGDQNKTPQNILLGQIGYSEQKGT